jgi:hypothetical protein
MAVVLGAGAAHSNRTAGAGDEKGTKLPEISRQFRIYYSRRLKLGGKDR